MADAAELSGTVKKMSPSGKGFVLNEYENWFNFGVRYEGVRPFAPGAPITITYEEIIKADGSSSFFVLTAWPTTGQPGPVPPVAKPSGPVPTNGPTPTEPAPVPAGPTPTPPNREQSILFQVCLKAAQDWVLNVEGVSKTPAEVLAVVDLYYHEGLRLISGEPEMPSDGDPGPEEPA